MMPVLFLMGFGDVPIIYVTEYELDGPSTALTGVLSDYFTLTLGDGVLASPVTITPSDGGAGGTFDFTTVILTDGTRVGYFRYTPAAPGTITISVTNDGGLADPDSIILAVSDPVPVDLSAREPIVMLKPAATRWYHRGR